MMPLKTMVRRASVPEGDETHGYRLCARRLPALQKCLHATRRRGRRVRAADGILKPPRGVAHLCNLLLHRSEKARVWLAMDWNKVVGSRGRAHSQTSHLYRPRRGERQANDVDRVATLTRSHPQRTTGWKSPETKTRRSIKEVPYVSTRAFQAEAKQAILAAWDEGYRKTLLALPTGCGKTVTTLQSLKTR